MSEHDKSEGKQVPVTSGWFPREANHRVTCSFEFETRQHVRADGRTWIHFRVIPASKRGK